MAKKGKEALTSKNRKNKKQKKQTSKKRKLPKNNATHGKTNVCGSLSTRRTWYLLPGETILKQEGIAEITLALTFWSRGLTCRIVRSKQFMHQFQHLFQSVSRSKLASSNMEVGAGVERDANSLLQQSLVKHNCAEVNDGCAGGFPPDPPATSSRYFLLLLAHSLTTALDTRSNSTQYIHGILTDEEYYFHPDQSPLPLTLPIRSKLPICPPRVPEQWATALHETLVFPGHGTHLQYEQHRHQPRSILQSRGLSL